VTFEYGTTTDYGNTIAASQSPVTGHSSTAVSAALTGFNPGTLYHFRIKAVNSLGTVYGSDLTLGEVPTATILPATEHRTTSATLNGIVNANYLNTVVTFEYGTTIDYGNTIPATPGMVTGNSPTAVSAAITGLNPGTMYHFRIKAVNSLGTKYSTDYEFGTYGYAPTLTTQAATGMTATGATLNAVVNANFLSTDVTFEYGTTTDYGSSITANQSPIPGLGNIAVSDYIPGYKPVSVAIAGLNPGTLYHFRVKAVNSLGSNYGSDLTFKTLGGVPWVVTKAATNMTTTGATLNGIVDANFVSTVVTFEYGTTADFGSTITATQSPVTGHSSMPVSAAITGLNPGALYYFRVKAVNSLGTFYGNDLAITSSDGAPTAITQAASDITTTGATLNGTVNTHWLGTTVTFEYGTTVDYGNTTTSQSRGGNSPVWVAITGLTPGTIYHFRMKAVNSSGTYYGFDKTFITNY
jgi:phosphodiesterase/alkaline phosphatase D-like protein